MNDKSTRPVKLKDSHNTIILINEDADPEQSVKKYIKDLRDYKKNNTKDLTKEKINISKI